MPVGCFFSHLGFLSVLKCVRVHKRSSLVPAPGEGGGGGDATRVGALALPQ